MESQISSHVLVSIHAPHARGDWLKLMQNHVSFCFNPRPSCEGRQNSSNSAQSAGSFNPRPSCEGRRGGIEGNQNPGMFQSTPLMRGATGMETGGEFIEAVSIHAPHARGDDTRSLCRPFRLVSIHAPHARGDIASARGVAAVFEFQSTPLMRGATCTHYWGIHD